MKPYGDLYDLWIQQQEYNSKIFRDQHRSDVEWMINYILGAHSELSELLEETNWKKHRIKNIHDFGPNIIDELCDITKYVISMWQLLGASSQDMIEYTIQKGVILEQMLRQEKAAPLVGRNILMVDLDGTLADFRAGFFDWLKNSEWKEVLFEIKPSQLGLHLDINNGWDYKNYNEAKLAFERGGGYQNLPSITNIALAVNALSINDWYIIVYTARPFVKLKHIWGDTWKWIVKNNLKVNELHFGYESRVIRAQELSTKNLVVALEDDPTLIDRYEISGIPVFISEQPYNLDIPSTKLVQRMPTVSPISIFNMINNIAQENDNVR
jgi:hypothetical protein